MNRNRLPRAAVSSLVAALAILAGLLVALSSHIAQADTDATTKASTNSVNFGGYVARNIVADAIEVCTDDCPIAVTDASSLRRWPADQRQPPTAKT